MPKKKTKRKTKKSEKKVILANDRGISAPENFLVGFIIASALLVSFLSLQSATQFPTSSSMAKISSSQNILEKKIKNLVDGYPIKRMSPYISQKNKRVASFLVAIAKKESNWGRHSPRKNGRECFNYWGYRGPENPTVSGYSCFDSPQEAVNIVGARISELIAEHIDTPQEMVAWKCGTASCRRIDRGAAKWIWDVEYYYEKLYPNAESEKQKQTAIDPIISS